MKRKIILVLSLALVVAVAASTLINSRAYATSISDETTIKYTAGCPSSPDGKHHMEGRGKCIAKVKSTGKKYKGQGGQCKYCYLLTVTQNNLFLNPSKPMGWYATRQATFTQGGPFTMEVKKIYKNNSTSEQIWKTFKWE